MRLKLTERQQAAVFALVLALAIAALYTYIKESQPPPVQRASEVRVSLAIEGASWSTGYRNVSTLNNTVFGILLEASQRLHFQVKWITYTVPEGVFVTSINGTDNGAGGKFWQYWVDGGYGDRAADKKQIFDGDLVVWKFDVPQEGG